MTRPPDAGAPETPAGGLVSFEPVTLGDLPVGGRLVLRCRKDWRVATVIFASTEMITLAVASPSGHTYRVRRPIASPLWFDGLIPVLGTGQWRPGLVCYDRRW